MAKKPRSQRRKKGNDGDAGNGDDSNLVNNSNNKDALSDTHTVDDNMSVMTFAEEFAFGGNTDGEGACVYRTIVDSMIYKFYS